MKDTKVIFLDCDGVINGYNWWMNILCNVNSKLKIFDNCYLGDKVLDIFGVHKSKVKILSKICTEILYSGYKCEVVMSSSWRGGYFSSNMRHNISRDKLRYFISLYRIPLNDKTGTYIGDNKDYYLHRSIEIKDWLLDHIDDVYSYVILDDDSMKGLEHRHVKTRNKRKQNELFYYEGLRKRHIKESLEILDKKLDDIEISYLKDLENLAKPLE